MAENTPAVEHVPITLGARVRGYVGLLHPFPAAMTVLAAGLFAVIAARGAPAPERLGLLLLSVALSQVAIASLNDYCDRALDAATKPWKPLPAGLVPPRAALGIALVATPLTLLCTLPLGPPVVLAATLFTAAGLAYDLWGKGTAWSALPFVVAFPALPIWGWSAVAPFDPRLLEGYVVGAPLVIALHLADTLPDLEADRAQGVAGLAHRLGPRRSRALMWGAFFATALLLGGLAASPGHAPRLLLPTAIASTALTLAALALSRGGETPGQAAVGADGDGPRLGVERRWQGAFALLASAAIIVGLGWLASLVSAGP